MSPPSPNSGEGTTYLGGTLPPSGSPTDRGFPGEAPPPIGESPLTGDPTIHRVLSGCVPTILGSPRKHCTHEDRYWVSDPADYIRYSYGEVCSHPWVNKWMKPVKWKSVKGKTRLGETFYLLLRGLAPFIPLWQPLSLPRFSLSGPALTSLLPASGRIPTGGAPETDRCQTNYITEGRREQLLTTPGPQRLGEETHINMPMD